jgi:cold shock CspA family protein
MALGRVREWHDEDGWGVLDTEETPGGCWAHFSTIVADGFRTLCPGDAVNVAWEAGEQDGFSFRALAVQPITGAHQSMLTLSFDDPGSAHVDLLAAAEARAAALASGDADNLRAVLHPSFTWTTHRGDVLDRTSYVAGNTDGSLIWRRQELTDVRTSVVGDTGVLTCTVTDHVVRDGEELTFTMPVTQTWVRQHGTWRCLAGHAGPAR